MTSDKTQNTAQKNHRRYLSFFFCAIFIASTCGCALASPRQKPFYPSENRQVQATLAPIFAPEPLPGDICSIGALEAAIEIYRDIADRGRWPSIPNGPTLRKGEQSDRVELIRQRLMVTGELSASENHSDVFDEDLFQAVRKFQKRHGLTDDGAVGSATLRELNVSVQERVAQLAANLKVCQKHRGFSDKRYILINIPDFSLKLYENGDVRILMPVIVGKPERPTPVCKGKITSIVINPSWKVPHIIATEDILPKVKKDPSYLEKSHISVLKGWEAEEDIDPDTIDWKSLTPQNFPYRFAQHPGPDNALGRLKLLFSNPYDIYLHDTPSKYLFARNPRAFSSGCIRLAKAKELAAYLLKETPLGSIEAINAEIKKKATRRFSLPSPIPIYIIYITAWVDPDGVIQFRPDIYKMEPALP
jgi:murein L,D-transpeptidase YcbB/YkuD